LCVLFTVLCLLCSSQCAEPSLQCPLCSDHCAVPTLQCPLCSAHFEKPTVQRPLGNAHYAVPTLQRHCAVRTVQCPLCSNPFAVPSKHCPLCIAHCAVPCVHCPLCSGHCMCSAHWAVIGRVPHTELKSNFFMINSTLSEFLYDVSMQYFRCFCEGGCNPHFFRNTSVRKYGLSSPCPYLANRKSQNMFITHLYLEIK
jgi:hypothetical protein